MKKGIIIKAILLSAILATAGLAVEDEKLGDVTDGSRAGFIHLIPLLAEPLPGKEPDQIFPTDEVLLPFSTKATCGACHDYNIISSGWHFNAADPNVPPGRNGQAWILADSATATQIPLSYRAWPGVFNPEQMGITPMEFLSIFGRQMPGGGIGEMLDKTDNPEETLRVDITGKLEINCLACHNISPAQDMGSAAGWAVQINRGNYRWAATASSEFAYVTGTTEGLSNYDFRAPYVPGDSKLRAPSVEYYRDLFKHNEWVRFDVSKAIPNQRCYFCHSNIDVRDGKTEPWKADEDVHLCAGLKCVDCHRHGLEHNITRGYATEANDNNNPLTAVSSCEGCHLEKGTFSFFETTGGIKKAECPPYAGRFTAPVPKHAGLPPSHFEKLTCTACHSGPWPAAKTIRAKTARAHALGVAGSNKSGDVLPHLTYPVFAKGQDGKIGVFKAFWPAYWAAMAGDTVTPLNLDTVKTAMSKVITRSALSKVGDWPDLKEEDIAKILTLLADKVRGAKPVYITGGRLYSLEGAGQITSAEHPVAEPYMWPIAHDVRPAAQSLGVRKCEDCHSTDSPFLFGLLPVDSPLKSLSATSAEMIKFEDLPKLYTKAFAFSFLFRPWLKIVAILSVLLIFGVLAISIFDTRYSMLAAGGGISHRALLIEKPLLLLSFLCFLALAATGFIPVYILNGSISGWWLMAHVTTGGIFAGCMAVLAVLWADKNRLVKFSVKRICFWVILVMAMSLILTAILSMFNLFGTYGQEVLLLLHRYSAIILSLFVIIYFITREKR
ncbi:MAG: hypothetical protein JW749_03750 [Sedimentisphaerales bacterium]|nr:hypothetical protein [Sedimentisphaerales bacterium]